MNDTQKGLYDKYKVERTDGRSGPGGKHERCEYFVLDLEHDKHAKAALRAYAKSVRKQHPDLAKDILDLMRREPDCGCRSAGHEACGRIFSNPRKPSFGEGD